VIKRSRGAPYPKPRRRGHNPSPTVVPFPGLYWRFAHCRGPHPGANSKGRTLRPACDQLPPARVPSGGWDVRWSCTYVR